MANNGEAALTAFTGALQGGSANSEKSRREMELKCRFRRDYCYGFNIASSSNLPPEKWSAMDQFGTSDSFDALLPKSCGSES
jgi:hypothetical protein